MGKGATENYSGSLKKTVNRILGISILLIVLGFGGFLITGRTLMGYVLAHTGALGIMVLFGLVAGDRALKKGRLFWRAFSRAFFLPILVGFIGAAVLSDPDKPGIPLNCGGAASLAVGFLVVIIYAALPRKN